ncbi:putative diguanylate cyclase YdaM [Fundidesulfovibrio magnetotacticus]|uniref:Putative diguanylate cyclase YdaM n=1 Tax=Fundidesulfovibrio magnetotacticus TaxID=2730080 RepID=A0A6V8LUT7_9BACT|nr:diguanylate cyclase [Fundidesulfovibrio magnetotacticus]GFK94341.1 putative diguanylate cyclase YdaM [Fundidesulfovibrio magnetotacticus]
MNAWILAAEAFAVYGLVLWSHSLRHRYGLAFFYALLGSLTAIMSWVTDAGVAVQLGDTTYLVGSTVFYTSLLLGVFVVYVFDGPRATRVAILTVVGVSALVPLISVVLHLQTKISSTVPLALVPIPSLRVNMASVLTTLGDLLFLAISWEFLHDKKRALPLAAKAFLTLLGVMWLDVALFNTAAFLGSGNYLSIMTGTLTSRLVICAFAAPILWAYLSWQNAITGVEMPHRPVFAILQELSEVRVELQTAREEIKRRMQVEAALLKSERRYRQLILNASEPIAVVHSGLYALHNARLLELTGLSETDARTATFEDFVHPAQRAQVRQVLDQALARHGLSKSLEFKAVRGSGDLIDVQANIVGIDWDGDGAVLVFLHDVTEQRRAEDRLRADATMDQLTGVLNRRGFIESAEAKAERLQRERRGYTVLYLDVDRFKEVNDAHGHLTGDKVLREVARAARDQIREGDVLGRVGGDEFAVLLAGSCSREARSVGQRIVERIPGACREGEAACSVTVSLGVASLEPGMEESLHQVLDRADKAMLAAKRDGRDRVRVHGDAPAPDKDSGS